MQEASGGSIWRRHHRRRHLEVSGRHLEASGSIWEATGGMEVFGRQLRGIWKHLGSI